jgi:hypothetical protein
MTYGVVICPRCEQVKAADLNFKTTKCLGCNKVMKLRETKIWAKTDDNEEIAVLVGRIKAELQGEEIEYPPLKKGSKRNKKKTVRIGSKRQKELLEVAINLTREKGTFQFTDFKKAVSGRLGTGKKEDVERFLAFLQARGVIIEPKPGTYRAIEDGL